MTLVITAPGWPRQRRLCELQISEGEAPTVDRFNSDVLQPNPTEGQQATTKLSLGVRER